LLLLSFIFRIVFAAADMPPLIDAADMLLMAIHDAADVVMLLMQTFRRCR